MADTNGVSITLRDRAGDRSSIYIPFPATTTVAQMSSFAEAFVVALDPVTDSVIEQLGISLKLGLPAGLKTIPGNQLNQVGALFNFDLNATRYTHSIRVPAIRITKLSGDSINLTDTEVQALINVLTSGSGGALPSDRFGNDILALNSASMSYRRRG
jgi:hypothetical protein